MSTSVQDATSEGAGLASAASEHRPAEAEVGGPARADKYVPDVPSNLPSNSEIRALRAQLGSSSAGGTLALQTNIPRFQGAGWTAQAVLAQTPGALLGRPAQEPNGPPPGRPMKAAQRPASAPQNGNRTADLWYAQAATFEAHQKTEQLTFRRLRRS